MTDCGRVDMWIDEKGFKTAQEAKEYVNRTIKGGDEPFVYDCIDHHDFESEFVLFHKTSSKGTKYDQLSRRNRATGRFMALGLDSAAIASIRNFLSGT